MSQPSPIPGFTSPMFGMRSENVNLSGSDMTGRNGIGMGLVPPGEDINTDSPKSSDFDAGHSLPRRGAISARLRSLSSSGASTSGSIQDINLSESHSSIPTMASNSNGNMLGGEPFQSHLSDNLDSSPFITGSSTAAATVPPSSLSMLPLKTTPTGSSSHLPVLENNVAATSLIAKPPSMLNDHHDLQHHTHHPSSSLSAASPDPSLLHVASASVHHVETLPNSSYNNTASSDCYMQPHPFLPHPPPSGSGPLPGGNFSHNLMGSPYHFSPQQHSHENFTSNSLPFATPSGAPHPPPPSSAPAIHVDNELAQVDEYMQQYLSQSHNQESLKANGAILNATKEHDSLISQVLLMSPNHHRNFDLRRSSGTTTAMFLSTLEETGKNGRGSPFSPHSAEALRLLASRRGSLDELTNATTGPTAIAGVDSGVGLRSPLQRRTSSAIARSDSVGPRSPLQRRTSSASASGYSLDPHSPLEQRISSTASGHVSSTASTPSSEANALLTSSHSRDQENVEHHTHVTEANSDTSSGVSSASTKFSNSTAYSSGQSSPIGSTHSPATLLSPLAMPSPTHSCLEDNLSYPLSVSSRDRTNSLSSNNGHSDLLDQIYEPYPALSNDEGEYMIENPDLRPPPAPKMKGKIDLHPEVPIFKVRQPNQLLCLSYLNSHCL